MKEKMPKTSVIIAEPYATKTVTPKKGLNNRQIERMSNLEK